VFGASGGIRGRDDVIVGKTATATTTAPPTPPGDRHPARGIVLLMVLYPWRYR
jgi:hypothetical protein